MHMHMNMHMYTCVYVYARRVWLCGAVHGNIRAAGRTCLRCLSSTLPKGTVGVAYVFAHRQTRVRKDCSCTEEMLPPSNKLPEYPLANISSTQ